MKRNQPSDDDEFTNREDFERALGVLIHATLENGIDPRGAWEYHTERTSRDWEVVVVELEQGSAD